MEKQLDRPVVRQAFSSAGTAVVASLLLLLFGVVYFAAESLEPEQPIVDIVMVIVLGSCALAVGWIAVGEWWARRTDGPDGRNR